jgi:PBP1b-binding outer membrane lipoprotein LpoB
MKIRSLMLMALLLSGCASMPSSPQQEAEGNMTGNDPITAEDNATQEERVDDVDEAIAIACTDAGVSQRELFDIKQQREEESGSLCIRSSLRQHMEIMIMRSQWKMGVSSTQIMRSMKNGWIVLAEHRWI